MFLYINPSLSLRRVYFNKMLQCRRVACERTSVVGFNINIYTLVTKHIAWSGKGSVIGAHLPAEWAHFNVCEWSLLVMKVNRWWRDRKGGQGFSSALVVWWMPPLQKLQEKHSDREAGWKRYSDTTNHRRDKMLKFLPNAEKKNKCWKCVTIIIWGENVKFFYFWGKM